MQDIKELKKLNILLKTINKINQEIAVCPEEKILCQNICDYLLGVEGFKMAWIGLRETADKKFLPIAISGLDKDLVENIRNIWKEYKFNGDPTSTALKNGLPYFNKDLKKVKRYVAWENLVIDKEFLSAAALPLKYHGDIFGSLHVYSDIKDCFLKEGISFLNEIAGDVGIGINSLRAKKTIKSLAKFPEENPDIVGRADYDGKLIYCNMAYKKAFSNYDHFPTKLYNTVKIIAAEKGLGQIEVEINIGNRIFLFNLIQIKEEDYVNFYGKDITDLRLIEHDVKERVKELEAFYGLSMINEKNGISIGELYQEVTELLIHSWQYPKNTCVRILYDGREFKTKNFKECKWKQVAPFKVFRSTDGIIEVGYLKERPKSYEGPFLKQERLLLDAIAERLGRMTERRRMEALLINSEGNLQMAEKLARIGSWKLEASTNSVQWSEELYHINGHDPKTPVPNFTEMSSFYTLESWNRLTKVVANALENGENYELELDLIRTDNTIINTFTKGEVHYDELGKVDWLNGTVQDISESKKVQEALKISYEKIKKILEETIEALASIVEIKDPYTSGHQKKVTQISVLIAKEMGLNKDIVSAISTAAIIHDIGKIYIPASILSKPGKLSDIEYEMIKTHSQTGYEMIKNIEFPWPIADIVLQHHEKINGSGYPKGLVGDAIMLEARIIAVADVVEAIASHRPYRPSLGIDQALGEIKDNKGIFYDPEVVDACCKLIKSGAMDLTGLLIGAEN
jgi:putative nucleotidyltransferase with HDIG domain